MLSLTPLLSTLSFLHLTQAAWPPNSPLIVKEAPNTVKPYVLQALTGFSFNFNGQAGRVLASNDSTGGAYTLLNFNSGFTTPGTVHSHTNGSESIYMVKGTIALWANEIGRIGTQNDFHCLPPTNNHTFALRDYDSEAIVSFQPGGYEHLLLALGAPYNSSTNTPYDPEVFVPINGTAALSLASKYGINFRFGAQLNNDFTNGTTSDGLGSWHVKNQELPGTPVPYFLASNFGPKYLSRSLYQVTIPLATGKETNNGNTISTIAMANSALPNLSKPIYQSFKSHQTFRVLEGQLTVSVAGQTINLIPGDVIQIPAGMKFKYESKVAWTRFYSYCGGIECLSTSLIAASERWGFPVFPGN